VSEFLLEQGIAAAASTLAYRREDHEVTMLCLHLLQNCMVYVNTLMLQQVLAQPHWAGKLTPRDLDALDRPAKDRPRLQRLLAEPGCLNAMFTCKT